MRPLILIPLLFLLLPGSVMAQSYISYQQILNRVDDDLFARAPGQALIRLDSVYHGYSFIYAKHCLKALQIACEVDDSLRAGQWLSRSFVQGVPLWVIRTNELTRKALNWQSAAATLLHYDSLRTVYHAHINKALAAEIDRLLARDYRYTRRVNDGFFLLRYTIYGLQWVKNNKREFKQLAKIIRQYGYPGERLTGLPASLEDSSANARFVRNNGMDIEIQDRRAYFMLLHYFSTRRKDINDLLLPLVDNGQLPVYFYATINDYIDRAGHGTPYYTHQSPPKQGTEAIDVRRAAIGLQTLEAQQRNRNAVMARRKMGYMNKGIILE